MTCAHSQRVDPRSGGRSYVFWPMPLQRVKNLIINAEDAMVNTFDDRIIRNGIAGKA